MADTNKSITGDYGALAAQLLTAANSLVNPTTQAKPAAVAPPTNNVQLPAPATKPNYPLYIGLGIGGLVLVIVLLKVGK